MLMISNFFEKEKKNGVIGLLIRYLSQTVHFTKVVFERFSLTKFHLSKLSFKSAMIRRDEILKLTRNRGGQT